MVMQIAEDAALLMLRVIIHDLRLKPDSTFNGSTFNSTFLRPPWRESDYDLGRKYLQDKGWVDTAGSMLRLTGLGYSEGVRLLGAPS